MASMVNPTLPYQAGLNHFLLFVGNDRSYSTACRGCWVKAGVDRGARIVHGIICVVLHPKCSLMQYVYYFPGFFRLFFFCCCHNLLRDLEGFHDVGRWRYEPWKEMDFISQVIPGESRVCLCHL